MPPVAKLTAAVMTACKVAALATAGVAVALGIATWGQDAFAASIGAGCVALAAWVGVPILRAARSKAPNQIPMFILAASSARLMLSLILGLIAFFVVKPVALPFWGAFLAAGLIGLVIETAWVVSALKKYNASVPAGAAAGSKTSASLPSDAGPSEGNSSELKP